MTTEEVLKLVDRLLDENVSEDREPVDVMILMGLHCDFTKLVTWKDTGCRIMVPNTKIDVSKLILDMKKKIIDWKEKHNYCQVIVTVPYIPDFGRYNHHRLYKKLHHRQVRKVYSVFHTQAFIKQMKKLIDEFFKCWDKELTPRPVSLTRMENLNEHQRKKLHNGGVRSFQGPTRDGLHFSEITSRKVWKLLKQHHDYLSRMPGKCYRKQNIGNPQRDRSEREITKRTQPQKSRWTGTQQDRSKKYQNYKLSSEQRSQFQAGPSGILQRRRNMTAEDLRHKIQNGQNQISRPQFDHVSRFSSGRKIIIETEKYYKKITKYV
ncbi:UNVERIFIED_CONTAM: hypothetical protein RMT77_017358 [Armadillidium vulgare]